MTAEMTLTPLQADLVDLLRASRKAERDLFATLPDDVRDPPETIGAWSPKDVLAHLGAWRAVEARRIAAARSGSPNPQEDPALGAPVDESNAQIHEDFAGSSWDEVELRADESVEALVHEIGESSSAILCDCQDDIVGIGANGVNHAMSHLSDIARLGDAMDRYRAYGLQIDVCWRAVISPLATPACSFYDLACHFTLADELEDARRLLRQAFSQRHDLRSTAQDDPDLESLRAELNELGGQS